VFASLAPRAGARIDLTSLAVLVLTVAACGGSALPAGQSGNDNTSPVAATTAAPAAPAETVTEAATDDTVLVAEAASASCCPRQVEAALGMAAVSAEAEKSSPGLGHSSRVVANDETLVDVTRTGEETLDEFKEKYETVGLTDETVEGLGAFAYRAPGTALGGPGARLAVYTGERHIGVTVYAHGDQATMFEAAEAIARSLLEQGL
jgi:hypothetical protein